MQWGKHVTETGSFCFLRWSSAFRTKGFYMLARGDEAAPSAGNPIGVIEGAIPRASPVICAVSAVRDTGSVA
jgi:hypothetical protein